MLTALFGKSIVAVRVMGAICVFATALLVCRIATRLHSSLAGELSGAVAVLLITFASRGQATMSETLAILPLAAGIEPFLLQEERGRKALWSGVCLAIAALVRLNLALVAVAVLVTLFVDGVRHREWRPTAMYVAGGAIPMCVFIVVYGQVGELDTLLRAVFVAPFAYAVAGVLANVSIAPNVVMAAFVPPVLRQKRFWLVTVAVVASILVSGGGAAHYWIQAHPFSALLVGTGLASGLEHIRRPRLAWVCVPILAVAFATLSDASLVRAYGDLEFRVRGRATELAKYLENEGAYGQPVFLLSDHIAHWWLDNKPLHRMATHPSNLFRAELLRVVEGPNASPELIVGDIFSQRPLYVVREKRVRHLDRSP
ncbi:MAG: glycosyltransferase family 39 protein, partial [Myxococcota bacterium]